MAWVDILGEGGGGDGDGECCPSSGAAWPGLAGAAVCLWPSASVCLFEGMVPRAGRAARHRPARHQWKSKVTRDSLAQPSPAQHHTGTRTTAAGLKGTLGPGAAAGVHTTAQPAPVVCWCVGVLVCRCVGVSPPGVFPLLVVAVCRGPAQPRRLEKALDVADTAPLLGAGRRSWQTGPRHTDDK